MQLLIVSLGNQQSSFRQLSDLIREEHKLAKEYVAEKFDQHRKDREKAEYCSKFLDSLAFPGMRARQEIITDPYSETFQWIFDESGKAVRRWGNFVEWLRHGQSIYWIQGKAGSGKSTLMRYICEEKRTEASLKTWAGAHKLLIIPFFFWKAGNDSPMQKTSAGLLRSLLYQILEKVPDLILSIAQNNNDPQGFQTGVHGLPSIPPWTEKRLLMIFRKLLSDLSSTHHLCLFIDGLDELDGNQNDLVELLQDKVRGPNMKICLSSRPDRSFIEAFSSPTMLRLEDLTREDIKLYVSRKLEGAWSKSPAVDDKQWLFPMIDTILSKAQGVFQWVHIVVGYQIQGLKSKDGLEELSQRLDELPEEIEELYAYMLKKIDRVHRKKVASILQIILQVHRNPSISELTLALYERRDILFSPQSNLPLIEIAQQCALVRQRVKLICGGLLEFRERNDVSSESEAKETRLMNGETTSDQGELSSATLQSNALQKANTTFHQNRTTRVHLIHRTAYDFFKDNQVGKEFVRSNVPSTFDVYGSYVEARLAQLMVLAQNTEFYHSPSSRSDLPESPASLSPRSSIDSTFRVFYSTTGRSGFQVEIDEIMRIAKFVEEETAEAQVALNEKIDKIITILDQQHLHQSSDTHWCTRWGFSRVEVDWSRGLRPENYSYDASYIQDVPKVPLDFLCFAAYKGLHLYVLESLRTRLERDDSDTMTVLLRCTMIHINSYCLEAGTALLRRGANPNVVAIVAGGSVWTLFLHEWPLDPSGVRQATEEQWLSTARTFIESGADVNAEFTATYGASVTCIVGGDVSTELKRFEGLKIFGELSVLAFLQVAIAPSPSLADIVEMCIVRGALWKSKSWSLSTARMHFTLSQRQSEDVHELVFARSSQRSGCPVSLLLESLREIQPDVYEELVGDKIASDEEDTDAADTDAADTDAADTDDEDADEEDADEEETDDVDKD